eukprot:CAMPEP_0194267122 /NCGR_PEP_ID=MMETSP0169-20130528/1766_1 /TAXON_ID=218684 /ORGANISM="Corethron pennatum, Strain L29A3" /LENGTH=115 /DNA_ID=CAMNT_0039007931 /DNA_START=101 /DNA_END=448 /DNA_ORIENTATION=+
MVRLALISLFALALSVEGFTAPSRAFVSSPGKRSTVLRMADDDEKKQPEIGSFERGVSMDQDGKSNVWAIEPKVELESKSAEEKTTSALIAGGGLIAFVGFAFVVLTNLPDPNSF